MKMIPDGIFASFALMAVNIKRSMGAFFILVAVSAVTGFALVGLLPFIEWITVQEALFLASINLVLMAIYFELISPKRDEVSIMVTSGLAVFGGIVASLTASAVWDVYPLHELHFIGAAGFLSMIVVIWFWYEIVVLRSFSERVEGAVDLTPIPDPLEEVLVEEEEDE